MAQIQQQMVLNSTLGPRLSEAQKPNGNILRGKEKIELSLLAYFYLARLLGNSKDTQRFQGV